MSGIGDEDKTWGHSPDSCDPAAAHCRFDGRGDVLSYTEKKLYEEKAASASGIMETEKQWIRDNQGPDGEIYLNNRDAEGDVDPYFACIAAAGLLSGTPSAQDIACTAAYLNWHIRSFLRQDGIITGYRLKGSALVPTGKYDSVDSYVAMLLFLIARYERKGGDLSEIDSLQEALTLSCDTLSAVMQDGLTCVSQENGTRYLMDNVEVVRACYDISAALSDKGAGALSEKYRNEMSARFLKMAQGAEEAVNDLLWNAAEKRYEVGIDQNNIPLTFEGWDRFYPDAVMQIYPGACRVEAPEKGVSRLLYEKLIATYPEWKQLALTQEDTDWPVIAYAAVLEEDTGSAESYLAAYRSRYAAVREYPMNTAKAGWVADTCEALEGYYTAQERRGMLADFAEWIRKAAAPAA
ncbi:MAG: hypothetical protein LKJ76_09050 [Lachnospiraceae bacterium]|jgi:hypothetical protein|nr:hypothetical protein [Lachnospiraceae bacterium]